MTKKRKRPVPELTPGKISLRPLTSAQKQRQRAGLDAMLEASTKMGLYDDDLVGVPEHSKMRKKNSYDKET
jgi:hypothetical protein